jgi:MFS superfamily sulfate permease-like transporter
MKLVLAHEQEYIKEMQDSLAFVKDPLENKISHVEAQQIVREEYFVAEKHVLEKINSQQELQLHELHRQFRSREKEHHLVLAQEQKRRGALRDELDLEKKEMMENAAKLEVRFRKEDSSMQNKLCEQGRELGQEHEIISGLRNEFTLENVCLENQVVS